LVGVFALVGCSEEPPTGVGGTTTSSDDVAFDPGAEPRPTAAHATGGVMASARTYEITLENLTPATGPGSSQPFSPPVLVTHRKNLRVFRQGKVASSELAQIAEDAVNAPMLDLLSGSHGVFEVLEGSGVIHPGNSAQYEIQAEAAKSRFSLVFMLVNTNDAFGGLDAVKLPRSGEGVYYIHAYDAGSEMNTELASHIPGPCCNTPGQGIATEERIMLHQGILGVGDLNPGDYGWTEPVAKLTITRIR
jgi:hypothetical protein